MTNCSAGRCRHEWRSPGSDGAAAVQATAPAGGGGAMCAPGGRGGAGAAHTSGLSGSPAGERVGRTGTEHDRTPLAGRSAAADEDAGRIRLSRVAEGIAVADPGTGEWGLHWAGGAGDLSRRAGNGENSLINRPVRGRVPAETAGTVHYGSGLGERTGGSQTPVATPPRAGPLARYELIALDEVGYVPMADVGAEFLFQVVAERAEKAAVIMTTNLPFSEGTQVIPNSRLCKALLDRVTDRAHIIETGNESYRFRRTLEKRKKKA